MFIKLIKNKIALSIVLIVTFLVIASLSSLKYQQDIKEIEIITWEFWKTGDIRRGGLVIKNSISENRQKSYVLTQYGIQNLVTQVILQVYEDQIQFETFYIDRTGFNTFYVNSSIVSTTTKYNFDKAIDLAKKVDVNKNNPDNTAIINRPDINLSQEEIDKNKKIADEQATIKQTQDSEKTRIKQTYPYIQGKVIALENEPDLIKQKQLIVELQDLKNKVSETINKNETYTFPDNTTLTPTEQHKNDLIILQETIDLEIKINANPEKYRIDRSGN